MQITKDEQALLDGIAAKVPAEDFSALGNFLERIHLSGVRAGYSQGYREGTINGFGLLKGQINRLTPGNLDEVDVKHPDTPIESFVIRDNALLRKLHRIGIFNLGQLVATPSEFFVNAPGIGKTTCDKVNSLLEHAGHRRDRIWTRTK